MAKSTKFGNYTLTRPITKDGEAFYWTAMLSQARGDKKNAQEVRNVDFKYFTYQALREAGLIEVVDHYYEITGKGLDYIDYYQQNSNPKISFFEHYANTTIKATKCKNQPTQEMINKVYHSFEVQVAPYNPEVVIWNKAMEDFVSTKKDRIITVYELDSGAFKCADLDYYVFTSDIFTPLEIEDDLTNDADRAAWAKIPTTNNEYKVEVKRQNGASTYCETYAFENLSDANIAKEIMSKAENTTAEVL